MVSDDRASADSLERRVALLEATVRALAAEVDQLTGPKALQAGGSPALVPASTESAHASTPERRQQADRRASLARAGKQLDLESLVGRYGTLVLATVTALAAVGTFLGWAIANGWLGPTQRIALGLIVATGLAVGGLRLRRRERSFGASLLGLALAVTHVCAWGAGPSLHLVPEWQAFILAAIVSIALAVFARLEDDEPLWSVGFSGAAVAPFVTSSGRGNLLLLAAYGVAVLSASGYAMGRRRWIVAGRLFLLAAAFYTAALATGFERELGPLLAMVFPLSVALLGVIPWVNGWSRRERLRALGVLAAVAAVRSGMGMNLPYDKRTVAAAIAAAGAVWLVIVDRTHAVADQPIVPTRRLYEGDWLDAGIVPMGFVLATLAALDESTRGSGIAMSVGAAVLFITVVRLPQGSLRDAAVFASVLCALIGALLLEKGRPLMLTATVAVLSALCFAANRVWRSVSWTTLGMIGLAWALVASAGHLIARPAYDYTPFMTQASGVAAIALVCTLVAWSFVRRERGGQLEPLMRSAVIAWAFIWVHQEIALAFNRTIATLLRVTYYASTSVAAVGIGRVKRIALLRHVGLALGLLAAGTALYEARRLDAIAARIGADLVAAVFLFAIAYWYRRPGAHATALPST